MKWILAVGGALTLIGIVKVSVMPKLKHFKPSEFGIWWPLMDRYLLVKLDRFRALWNNAGTLTTAP